MKRSPLSLAGSAVRSTLLLMTIMTMTQAQVDSVAIPSPKREVRAVWLTTSGGADWPKSYNTDEQRESLLRIFGMLKAENFNTVFFQVRSRGNTMYESQYEPWAGELTGVLGKNPGWDPLAFAIEAAHRFGMELHAWFNVAKVSNGTFPPVSKPPHVLRAHPEWGRFYEGEWWVDMGRPEVRAYTEKLVMEIVRNYDIDGIHLDYLRYPGPDFDDWGSYRLYSDGMDRSDWRRENLNTFVRDLSREIRQYRPSLKIGVSPVGIYRSIPGAETNHTGYDAMFQDSRRWLAEREIDYVAPQIYWDFGEQENPKDPDFESLAVDWVTHGAGRQVYIGIGAYRDNVRAEVLDQVRLARSIRSSGEAFFRYEDVLALPAVAAAYRYPALIPPMPWIDSIPPLPPANVTVTPPDVRPPVISWSVPPPAADGDLPWRYVVYRSTTPSLDTRDPRNIAAILPANRTTFVDESVAGWSGPLTYAITSLDRGNNESGTTEVAPEPTLTAEETPADEPQVPCELWQNYPEPFSLRTYIPYELGTKSRVEIDVIDSVSGKAWRIVDGVQGPGTYIATFLPAGLPAGSYTCRIKAGGTSETRSIHKE